MAGCWARPSGVGWLSGLLVSVTMVAAVSGLIGLLEPHVPVLSLLVLYLLAVLPVAIVWGTGLAVVTSILGTAVFAYLFLPPVHSVRVPDSRELAAMGVFLVTAVVVGELAARSRRVALEGARLSQEQSPLRRVATLVARGVGPDLVFGAVAEEAGALFHTDATAMWRFEPDGQATLLGAHRWLAQPDLGTRINLEPQGAVVSVRETGRAARVDVDDPSSARMPAIARAEGLSSVAASPIVVDGRLWGTVSTGSRRGRLSPGTESRLAGFTELVATAIANAQAREELRRIADEQAALRRVATLVARGEPPSAVFAAVAEEVGALFGADTTGIARFEPDGEVTFMAGHGMAWVKPGASGKLNAHPLIASVRETGRPARLDADGPASADLPEEIRAERIRSVVDAPIVVQGRVWGVIGVGSWHGRLSPETEQRLADFTELVANAIANAQAQAELTASRARIVATADQTRRRIERDLHDGAQQRLVSLALQLHVAQAAVPPDLDELAADLDHVAAGLDGALEELREFARGIHPAILAEGGLGPALRTLARRCSVPVQLQVGMEGRLPEQVEVAAYYVVAEALTNVAKHAGASVVQVEVDAEDGLVRVGVRDDGFGGADPARGSGLVGLKDRVEATGGTLRVDSRAGQGTSLLVELPIDAGQPLDST